MSSPSALLGGTCRGRTLPLSAFGNVTPLDRNPRLRRRVEGCAVGKGQEPREVKHGRAPPSDTDRSQPYFQLAVRRVVKDGHVVRDRDIAVSIIRSLSSAYLIPVWRPIECRHDWRRLDLFIPRVRLCPSSAIANTTPSQESCAQQLRSTKSQ